MLTLSVAGTLPATAHAFAKSGTITVTETIADAKGNKSNTVTFTVTVSAPATAGISGTVFNDVNGDGKLSAGELGLGAWTVELLSGSTVVKTVVTPYTGDFSFTGLAAGTYVVKVVQFPGTTATKPTGGTLTLTLTVGQASTGNLFGEEAIV